MHHLCKNGILLTIFSMLVLCLSACQTQADPQMPHMEVTTIRAEDGTAYTKRNGTEQNSFEVKADETCIVDVTIHKQAGRLKMLIAQDGQKENVLYEGDNIPTCHFTVNVRKAGSYTLFIEADDFIGDYCYELSKTK